jgi:NhaP-type Na+/H+ or K+/H+ antiporter
MINEHTCRICGSTISVYMDNFQFYRTDVYSGTNLYTNQYVCPNCGAVNDPLKNNKYLGTLEFTKKSILLSIIYSIFGWFCLGYVIALASIAIPADFKNMELVSQQNYLKEMWSFPWLYGLICIGFAILNVVVLFILVKSRYEFDFISQNNLMPIGQSITMLQSLVIFTILSLCVSYFIIPKIILGELILNAVSVRLFLGVISGALASSWTHRMFFKVCRGNKSW